MNQSIDFLPNVPIRDFSSSDKSFSGQLTIKLSHSAIFVAEAITSNSLKACDIDDITFDTASNVVSLTVRGEKLSYQMSSSESMKLFQAAIAICNDIVHLSLRLNISLRDCFYSGIRCGGSLPSSIDHKAALSSLYTIMAGDLAKFRPATATTSSNSGAAVTATRKPVRTAPKKCFFCQIGAKKYRQDNLMEHPYVPLDFKGAEIMMCKKCISAWKYYRDSANQMKELILVGESNEELCALCSSLPDTLVLCATCPRSYCETCLSLVIGQAEFKKMKAQEDWRCMVCTVSARGKEKEKKLCKASEPVKSDRTSDKFGGKCTDLTTTKKNSKKRKATLIEKEASDIDPLSQQTNVSSFEGKKLDELFYFGQYIDIMIKRYETPPMCEKIVVVSNPQEENKNELSTTITEDSEDSCLLCKDGT